MGNDDNTITRRGRDDFLQFAESARAAGIELCNINTPFRNQIAEAVPRVFAFATRNWNVDGCADLTVTFTIFRNDRFPLLSG